MLRAARAQPARGPLARRDLTHRASGDYCPATRPRQHILRIRRRIFLAKSEVRTVPIYSFFVDDYVAGLTAGSVKT